MKLGEISGLGFGYVGFGWVVNLLVVVQYDFALYKN